MATDKRLGKRLPEWVRREDVAGVRIDSGPFIGIVKNNSDPTRSGRLQVWIPDLGGDETDPKSWRTVGYASPFFGSTYKLPGNKGKNNKFDEVAHTYGMWAVPPDLENQVICTFISGDPGKGYWFACVNPMLSHHMVPSLGAGNVVDNTLTDPSIKNRYDAGVSHWPVTEFNEEVESNMSAAYVTNPKPVHEYQAKVLLNQGLDKDPIRGAIYSSSQRESPSMVFGISTPGRPVNDPASDATYVDRAKSGKLTDADLKVQARKGGHTFVMDDGDYAGKSQLVRLRTAGGHQILMNDSEQVVYIANSNGTAWFEFTGGGHINMYSQGGVNLRTEGEFNVHADKDINLNSRANINLNAAQTLSSQSRAATNKSSEFLVQSSVISLKSTGDFKIQAATAGVKIAKDLVLHGDKIFLNSTVPDNAAEVANQKMYQHNDTVWNSIKGVWESKSSVYESNTTVAPAHEPWKRTATANAASLFTAQEPSTTKASSLCEPKPLSVAPVATVSTGSSNESILESYLKSAGVVDPIKLAAIMAQCAHESGNFKYVKELGNDAYFAKYEPSTSIGQRLGNTAAGDGAKFKGRGFIQLTGRYNYTAAATQLSLDLVNNPSIAEDPAIASRLVYWFFFVLNRQRTANLQWDNVVAVTKLVNGGTNGLSDRQAKYEYYKNKYANNAVTTGTTVVVDAAGAPVSSASSQDPGIQSAAGKAVQSPAPITVLQSMQNTPVEIAPAGKVPGLLGSQVKALMAEIAYAESNIDAGKYNAALGRAGKYQINGLLLKEFGYVSDSANISNPAIWVGKDGVKSLQDWLANDGLQDKLMQEILQQYYKTMTTNRAIQLGDDVCTVGGMLSVAYFFRDFTAGFTTGNPTSQAKFWREQGTQANKQGVPGHVAYNQGRYAIDVLAVQAAEAANPVSPTAVDTVSGVDPKDVISFSSGSGDMAHYAMLGTSIRTQFELMAKEFKEKTGRKINLSSAVRTLEEQTNIYNAYNAAPTVAGSKTKNVPGYGNISMPAKPSENAPHIRGIALDISKADLAQLEALGLLGKYNFVYPFPVNDPVHIQFKG